MRNEAALIFNVRFQVKDNKYDYLAVGDSDWSVLEDIAATTKAHKNMDRLEWDLYNIPHHCSYLALSDEKGKTETEPKPLVKEILLSGKDGAYIVSSSMPISDTKEAYRQSQPPHVQAKNCYQRYLEEINGARFFVTMEEPNTKTPKPLVFKIDDHGVSLLQEATSAAGIITSKPAPRAG